MPQIANWPKTRAEAQAILEAHPEATSTETHACKVCNDKYWCPPNPLNGRFRSFCSKACYYRNNEKNPGFQRYRNSDKGKAMRRQVRRKSSSRPEVKARAAQYQRWVKLVLTLDPSQRPFDTTPWPTCTTDGCHNILPSRIKAPCRYCAWQQRIANRPNTWRNAGKPCKGRCGKTLTRYQQHTCLDEQCVKTYQRESPQYRATRRKGRQRRRARKRACFVEIVDVMMLLKWQHGKCYHCDQRIDVTKSSPHPKSLTLDHLVPLALGGDHSYANTVASCWDCNCSIKGVRPIGEQLKLV